MTSLNHSVHPEVVEVLEATALLLPQVTQLEMLPAHWQAELLTLAQRAQRVLAMHVYRGRDGAV